MPRFEPFAALRYSAGEPLDDVTAPPYDVLSIADVETLLARHPHNIVAIDVPLDRDGPQRYDAAGRRLHRVDRRRRGRGRRLPGVHACIAWTSSTRPAAARSTVGVIGALEVVDEGAGGVLPHERTTPKAKTDRLDLTRATHCNLSPIWGLSLTGGLTALLQEPGEPVGRCTDDNGVVHRVERIADRDRIAAIAAAVAANPVLIADGHHRYAISRSYRDEVRAATGRSDTDAELTMTYVAELVEDQLSIDPIHRVYRGVHAEALLDAAEPLLRNFRGRERSHRGSPPRPSTVRRCASFVRMAPVCGCHHGRRRSTACAPSTAPTSSTRLPTLGRRGRLPTRRAATCSSWCVTGEADAAVLIRPTEHRRDPAHRRANVC